MIYCRYLDALVFGPPGADIICLKKCARQRGPPTTVLPILRGSRAAPLLQTLARSPSFRLLFRTFSLFFSLSPLFFSPAPVSATFDDCRAFASCPRPRLPVFSLFIFLSLCPLLPEDRPSALEIVLRPGSASALAGREQQVAELDLATSEILVFYHGK